MCGRFNYAFYDLFLESVAWGCGQCSRPKVTLPGSVVAAKAGGFQGECRRAGLALLSRAGRGLLGVGVHRSALGSSLPVVDRTEANEGQLLLTPHVPGWPVALPCQPQVGRDGSGTAGASLHTRDQGAPS